MKRSGTVELGVGGFLWKSFSSCSSMDGHGCCVFLDEPLSTERLIDVHDVTG